MNEKDKREWKAEMKLNKAVRRLVKAKPGMIDFHTHVFVKGRKYYICIRREEGV